MELGSNLSGFWSCCSKLFFFVVFVTLVSCLYEKRYPNIHDIGFLLLKDNYNYWFIKAYLMLYIMSPVLNAFVESATKEQFRLILILFFGFTFLWGWLLDGAVWIKHGHSGIFFMGLYLLSRYMNLYAVKDITIQRTSCIIVYLLMSVLIAISAFVMLRYGKLGTIRRIYYYTCPLVIIQAAAFMLFVTKIKLKSAVINWIAISTLAIYLVHSSPFWSKTFYDNLISEWFVSKETSTFLIRTAILVFVTFWLSIFVDKIRIAIWNAFSKLLEHATAQRSKD